MVYLLLLLPIFTTLVLYIFIRNKIAYQAGVAFIILTGLYAYGHSSAMKESLTEDKEWWGNYATSVHYFDDWDEEVPCRHPIYCTETYECGDGKVSKTCTREYVCGYEHAYDVDYHSEYWSIQQDNGSSNTITHQAYDHWVKLWGAKKYKIELNRIYHKNDGDDIACDWDLQPEHSETFTTIHTYENRTQASNTIFKSDRVDSVDVMQYGLFEYPAYGDKVVLGYNVNETTNRLLSFINGYYGSRKEFKLYICCFRNKSEIAAERQHSYWDNLNKNEFLVCLGVNDSNAVQWCKSYSWMDKPILSVKVEQWFKESKSLRLDSFARWLPANINQYWGRKHFKDFNYIQVEITHSQYTVLFVFCLVICLIQTFVTIKLWKTLK